MLWDRKLSSQIELIIQKKGSIIEDIVVYKNVEKDNSSPPRMFDTYQTYFPYKREEAN